MAKYVYIWEYKAKNNSIKEFEEFYNSQGTWVELFKLANGYIKTDFFKDKIEHNRFITVDYWESYEAYDQFRIDFDEKFQELDQKCAHYTLGEKKMGEFTLIE